MRNKKVIIALVANNIRKTVSQILNKKLADDNYEVYCIGNEYNMYETLRFEPNYVLSPEHELYKVEKSIFRKN